jgi:rare lipoprotein A
MDTAAIKKRMAKVQYGIASWYSDKFNGRKTANGEIFSQQKMTCAHNFLPMGTWLKVTNVRNKRSVVVRVNDRLHPKNKRVVDVTRAAAQKLGMINAGLVKVKVDVLGKNPGAD